MKQKYRLSTALFYPINKDILILTMIADLMDSLVVQLLLLIVQLILAKADLKITEQTVVELYLQNKTESLT